MVFVFVFLFGFYQGVIWVMMLLLRFMQLAYRRNWTITDDEDGG
jgi:hypothetical protein